MQLSQRLSNALKKAKSDDNPRYPLLVKWIAESQSRQPALTYSDILFWKPVYHGAREGLAVFFLSLWLPTWEKDFSIQHLAEAAYRQEYSGYWAELQYFMENSTTLEGFLALIDYNHLEDEFYGNFLDLAERLLRRNRLAFRRIMGKPSKVRYPQRKRGYRDKGSLRPDYKKGRNIGESEAPVDRREAAYSCLWSSSEKKGNKPTMKEWAEKHIPSPGKEELPDANHGSDVATQDRNADGQASTTDQQAQKSEPLSLGSFAKKISSGSRDQTAAEGVKENTIKFNEAVERDCPD